MKEEKAFCDFGVSKHGLRGRGDERGDTGHLKRGLPRLWHGKLDTKSVNVGFWKVYYEKIKDFFQIFFPIIYSYFMYLRKRIEDSSTISKYNFMLEICILKILYQNKNNINIFKILIN